MLQDSCRILYRCEGCGSLLRPQPGDCFVICSYGSQRCPTDAGAPFHRK